MTEGRGVRDAQSEGDDVGIGKERRRGERNAAEDERAEGLLRSAVEARSGEPYGNMS